MSNDLISRSTLMSHIENERRQWGENYDAEQILEVCADEAFLHLYENKIMNEVARVFAVNYKNRYASVIMAENV